ncbi:hypothetical protein FJY71_06325 [candidate division WOR-3 bacterium]|nr:hypothetical protein [candidate division WOR-3 bacterium]
MRAAALCFLVMAGFGACDREEAPGLDPGYSEPMVNAFLIRTQYYDYSVDYSRYVEVFDNDGLRMVPVVTLNADTLLPFYYNPTQYRYGDENQFAVHAKYNLSVRHYWGEAFSHVVMPGNFSIESPPEGYILDIESTLVAAWQRSAGAQWYWLELYVSYDYTDSFGRWDDYDFELDTLVTDTFLRVSPRRIFPWYVADVLEGDASVVVWSGNGPAIEPGDQSNVRGAGFGFFNATNEPREKYFYVGAPPLRRRVPGQGEARARFTARLRARGQP